MFTKKSIVETLVAVIVFLFLYTALSKYIDVETFKSSLDGSPILNRFSGLIAVTLPAIEIGLVLMLTFYKTRLWGLYSSAALLSIFTVYLIWMVSFSKELPCGCGGVISLLTWKTHILFNIFFILLSLIAIKLQRQLQRNSHNTSIAS